MEATSESFTATKNEIKALLAHASKDPAREQLMSVMFNFSQGRVWSTDGHRLLVVTDGEGKLAPRESDDDVVAVATEHLQAACKLAKARDRIRIAVAGDRVRVSVMYAEHQDIAVYEGDARQTRFAPPDVAAVMPDYMSRQSDGYVGINGHYLADVKLLAKIGDGFAVRMHTGTELEPVVLVRAVPDEGNLHVWRMVIMPMRL